MDNVFNFPDRLVDEYSSFSRSFARIAADGIREEVERQYQAGRYWPEPERVSRLGIIRRNMNDEDWRKAVSSPEREVIASQRIEDVDARPWINSPVG